jgi:hypothetical protein
MLMIAMTTSSSTSVKPSRFMATCSHPVLRAELDSPGRTFQVIIWRIVQFVN